MVRQLSAVKEHSLSPKLGFALETGLWKLDFLLWKKGSLIQERVKAGLRNAKAKGQRLGRPRVVVDKVEILDMRNSGASWRKIAEKLGVGLGTVHRIAHARYKTLYADFLNGSPKAL